MGLRLESLWLSEDGGVWLVGPLHLCAGGRGGEEGAGGPITGTGGGGGHRGLHWGRGLGCGGLYRLGGGGRYRLGGGGRGVVLGFHI